MRRLRAQSLPDDGVDVRGTKALARGNIGEAHQGMHESQLPGMIQLEAGNALAVGENRWFGKFAQLTAVDERFQDVLLGIVVVVDDLRHALAEFG